MRSLMFDFRIVLVITFCLNLLWDSIWPTSIGLPIFLVGFAFWPKVFHVPPKMTYKGCFGVLVAILFLAPYVMAFTPGGGVSEQYRLDQVIRHLKVARAVCDDEEMKDVLDYTIRRYNKVGPFNVRFVQLDENTLGINVPWCPGVTLDTDLWTCGNLEVARTLVHEAMHDYYPYIGHSHIDNERIYRAVTRGYTITNSPVIN